MDVPEIAKILAYYKFYSIDIKDEYYIFKNKHQAFFIVFKYRESLKILNCKNLDILSSTDLFFHLFESTDLLIAQEIAAKIDVIDDFEPISIIVEKNPKNLLNYYISLKKEREINGTPIYIRENSNCFLLKEKERLIDIVHYSDDNSEIDYLLGNSIGYNFIPGKNHLSIHYKVPGKIKELSNYLFLSYDPNQIALLKHIKEISDGEYLILPYENKEEYLFSLKIIMILINHYSDNHQISISENPNKQQLHFYISFNGNTKDKIIFIGYITALNNKLLSSLSEYQEILKEAIYNNNKIDIKPYTDNGKHIINISFPMRRDIIKNIITEVLYKIYDLDEKIIFIG